MVSSIANGGEYIPPHILLASTDEQKGDPRLKAEPFRPEFQLPANLPDGAHRVITEMTSAKMRAMMEGIVVDGTGKLAALNGYSSAGKTGTAQKIDPATHTYSHTMLVASFAGFAPVNDPAIAIAVVIDSPTQVAKPCTTAAPPAHRSSPRSRSRCSSISACRTISRSRRSSRCRRSQPTCSPTTFPDESADLSSMFDQINSLPADDPLRQPATAAAMQQNQVADERAAAAAASAPPPKKGLLGLPDKVLSTFHANGDTTSVMPDANTADAQVIPPPHVDPAVQSRGTGAVVVDAGKRVAVPEFRGSALRSVVESATTLGLRVETLGSGFARDQMPAAGTMVPPGTEIVVRFAR